jgi:hypothetical protein
MPRRSGTAESATRLTVSEPRLESMSVAASWRGSSADWNRLWLAIGCHCTCEVDGMGVERTICAAHRMLEDQVILDHLLRALCLRQRWIHTEWNEPWLAANDPPPTGRDSPASRKDSS